ncbi:MAG: stage 0 sporulation family protein [Armatimonadetes bacterium]|nr:stage 0 sporulation family protein [Armatimonadota bacterium]
MPLVVGISFRKVGKVYYFNPGELALKEGDFVIAETARGVEFGEVVLEPRQVSEVELVAPLKRVVRVANGADLEHEAANREKERNAYEVCERKINEHGLVMKLLEAECAFDGSQVTFSFSAEGRIDFRELVKDVAGALKTKVQLHQIGVRDEAKLVGGYGGCGRPLCCATFLSNFEPISMKMAKDQSLFLNPAKFSGCCGKLMCCLRYEHEHYKESQRRLPAVGAILQWEKGRARVLDVNVINYIITMETEDGVQIHVPANQLKLEGICRRHGIGCSMTEKNCQTLIADPDHPVVILPDDEEDDDIVDDFVDIVEDVRFPSSENRNRRPEQPTRERPAQDRSTKGVTFREPTSGPQSPQKPQQGGNGGQNQGERTDGARQNRNNRNRPRGRGDGGNRGPSKDSPGGEQSQS